MGFIRLHGCGNLGSVCIATRRGKEGVGNRIEWALSAQVTDNGRKSVRDAGGGTKV